MKKKTREPEELGVNCFEPKLFCLARSTSIADYYRNYVFYEIQAAQVAQRYICYLPAGRSV